MLFLVVENSPLREKSYEFSLRVVRLSKVLIETKHEFVLGRQLLRSGTSIGAQIREGQFAESSADFKTKMTGELKEANETIYWLRLLHDTGSISENEFNNLSPLCEELIAMLAASVKTIKLKLKK